MSTYGAMQDRIADEIARTDLTSNIQKAIQSAITHYQRQRFYFNEALTTLTVSSSQEYYGLADNANIPNLSIIDTVRLSLTGGGYLLTPRDWEQIEALNAVPSFGDPTDFVYYGKQLRLSSIPNAQRQLIISGVYSAPTLSATGDTNYWMADAEELIRARAKWSLYKVVIKDREQAEDHKEIELEALAALRGEDDERLGTWRFRPTAF